MCKPQVVLPSHSSRSGGLLFCLQKTQGLICYDQKNNKEMKFLLIDYPSVAFLQLPRGYERKDRREERYSLPLPYLAI